MKVTGPGTGFSEDLVASVVFRPEPPGERKNSIFLLPELSDALCAIPQPVIVHNS